MLIAWANSDEVPDLEGSTAGIGGSTPARVRQRVQFVTGMVVLDTDAYDRMELRGDERSQELILAHELGHVLGLDHVDDVGELMNAEYVGQDGFGPGDRDGLQRLHDLPCSQEPADMSRRQRRDSRSWLCYRPSEGAQPASGTAPCHRTTLDDAGIHALVQQTPRRG